MAAVAENSSDNQFINRSHRLPCDQGTDYKAQRDVNRLVELLSKLNPLAKEFFPSSYTPDEIKSGSRLTPNAPVFVASSNNCSSANGRSSDNRPLNLRTRNGYNQGRRRMTERVRRAEREESIRRTVYVSDIDQNVTEEQLAELFTTCGQVTQSEIKLFFQQVCGEVSRLRLLGDIVHSTRIAFVEFLQN